MLDWLICAAAIAATPPVPAASDDAQAEFLEFLADWDATEAAQLEADRTERPADTGGADDESKMEKLR